MKHKVAIIDYGMGNLYSVRNAFTALRAGADIVTSSKKLTVYDKLVLPGVGAFGDAMRELKRSGLIDAINEFIVSGKPFLGICLGMQLLMDSSKESPGVNGLSLISGTSMKFSGRLKCPHMGWNMITMNDKGSCLYKGLKKTSYAYFCHSYFVSPKDKNVVTGVTDYGIKFASIIRKENIYGMQFHPEKSQGFGLDLLKNFINLC